MKKTDSFITLLFALMVLTFRKEQDRKQKDTANGLQVLKRKVNNIMKRQTKEKTSYHLVNLSK